MLFHSLEYGIFLFVVVSVFWLISKWRLWRIIFLLIASYYFYAYWNPYYLILLWFTSTIDYFVGSLISNAQDLKKKKRYLLISIISNLGILCIFKYFNFFNDSIIDIAKVFGYKLSTVHLNLILPVGISFFTFQSLSYTIDVYRGKIEAEKSYIKFLLFVALFPQLIAGPIVRAGDLLPQIDKTPVLKTQQGCEGLFLILRGLIKKVAIADFIALNFVDRVFDYPDRFSSVELIIAMYAYGLQIYCDFSGYTDIAIGSAKLLGFELTENFNLPYRAKNLREFWKRWHISLSTWLRDYLYISLGGSKNVSKVRTYINLFITMLLGGLWHGAAWTFIIWGVLHGIGLIITRLIEESKFIMLIIKRINYPKVWNGISIFITFHFVMIAWLIFRSETIEDFGHYITQVFQFDFYFANIPYSIWIAMLAGYVGHFVPVRIHNIIKEGFIKLPSPVMGTIVAGCLLFLYKLVGMSPSPFIYFQF